MNKHQLKSEATRRDLLEAAERIFARDGYAGAQIEAIAQEIGRTKGAVYAQFKNKEDLFLALMEKKIRGRMDTVLRAAREQTPDARFRTGRDQFLDHAAEDRWPILLLEFKLYAFRNQSASERIRELYQLLFSDHLRSLVDASGELSGPQQEELKRAIACLRAIPGAIALERHFEPALEARDATSQLLQTVFDSLYPRLGEKL